MKTFLVIAVMAVGVALVNADDGWVGSGGSPKLMRSHPSVQMMKENVLLTVHRRSVSVRAKFWFYNSGPAVTVRMGFPDTDDNVEEGDSVQPILKKFRSWIGDVPVKTRFLIGKDQSGWHVKDVYIAKGDTVLVRDFYTIDAGIEHSTDHQVCSVAAYRLDTGASWKGVIKQRDIRMIFGSDLPKPHLIDQVKDDDGTIERVPCASDVWVEGLSGERLRRRTLTWKFSRLKPTEDDNIRVYFRSRAG